MDNQPHHPSNIDHEREMQEAQLQRDRERRVLQQQEELAQREREHNERERERQHREQYQSAPPHQNNTGAIPLHQPVASRLPGAIHSPGGLLANHSSAVQSGLGAPNGPNNVFGGPLHAEAGRSMQQLGQSNSQQQPPHMFGPPLGIAQNNAPQAPAHGANNGQAAVFGGPLQQDAAARSMQQMPFPAPGGNQQGPQGQGPLGSGQQPILNDALSYLDQVKVQFVDQPDVYNRFLDIMKDFKSQAIDTPGVINRVSELFAGHPNLIQGFNTFLPPGYRIECGGGNDPNTIRVTTPMGTTVQSITGGRPLADAGLGQASANGSFYGPGQRVGSWQQQSQHSVGSPEAVFSPHVPNAVPPYANQAQSAYEAQQAAGLHQQQQRGISQLQSAATTAAGLPVPRNTQTPTPGSQAGGMNGGVQQPGMEKRGPVEFNHAISYVNKIKNRFQDKPEIYKQFLEILQTYQRESKPIQDVYAQVTTLFNTAPDLLEDFKQFLPESAAHAKAAAKAAEDAAALANVSQTPQSHPNRPDQKTLPPLGNFAPPPSSSVKHDKKRGRTGQTSAVPINLPEPSGSGRNSNGQPSHVNKRTKLTHKPTTADAPAVSPTLTPARPSPLPPTSTSAASSEEMAFFDRVKKYISNKTTMNEFLKLCNLFSQDLIDRNVLVNKVSNFIGGNPELMSWFKAFVQYDGNDEVIENKPRAPSGRVALSNCRGLGPSYRLLPKRETLKPCTGRDEMCKQVLNDEWASHPTWASEDSGFVAHRKNQYEEALHRIEEERHDYDFNIEANSKVIQLLEPIAQQIRALTQPELSTFRMPAGLGGSSQSIYKRILKKVYGSEAGLKVADEMFRNPTAVIPVVLSRLKQKDEEWRFTQREWDKVWHAQTQAMYLKSLDHMGLAVKNADKKNFATKTIIDQIKTKYEEQKRVRKQGRGGNSSRAQCSFSFDDQDVILDSLRLLMVYAENTSQYNGPERERAMAFFEEFIATFFMIPDGKVRDVVNSISRGSPDEDADETMELPSEVPNGRGRRPNGKKSSLLQSVLGRNGVKSRGRDSAASGSKESTPEVGSGGDEDMADTPEDPSVHEVTSERWLAATPRPDAGDRSKTTEVDQPEWNADLPYVRREYSLFCNQTIVVFFHHFQILYIRLKALKDSEEDAIKEVIRSKKSKPAADLGLIDRKAEELFNAGPPDPDYYHRTLDIIEDFLLNNIEDNDYQNFLRHYYLKKGWGVYSIPELLKHLCRTGSTCASPDPKDKTFDIIRLFYEDREREETSYQTEINYRKQVAKYLKDAEMFQIKWFPKEFKTSTKWIQKDETTFELSTMEAKERWEYYVSSYSRIEPTEGVPRAATKKSVLTRNLPSASDTNSSSTADSSTAMRQRLPLNYAEDLGIKVCVNTYRMKFTPGTSEYFIYSSPSTSARVPKVEDADAMEGVSSKTAKEVMNELTEKRTERFKEKFILNSKWKKNLGHEEVSRVNRDFEMWTKDGVIPGVALVGILPDAQIMAIEEGHVGSDMDD